MAEASAAKRYDDHGFLITTGAALNSRSSPTPVAEVLAAAETVSSMAPVVSKVSAASPATLGYQGIALLVGLVGCILAGVLSL